MRVVGTVVAITPSHFIRLGLHKVVIDERLDDARRSFTVLKVPSERPSHYLLTATRPKRLKRSTKHMNQASLLVMTLHHSTSSGQPFQSCTASGTVLKDSNTRYQSPLAQVENVIAGECDRLGGI